MSLRTPLGQVRGIGAAGQGAHHWWTQRITAVALVPLLLWFVASMVSVVSADYASAAEWVRSPLVTALLLLLIFALFYHAMLGVQVVLEDYVHSPALKVGGIVLVKLVLVLLGTIAAVAVLRTAFGG